MSLLAVNVLLAVAWAGLTADFSIRNLAIGQLLGFGALWIASPLFEGPSRYFRSSVNIAKLIGHFLYELVVGSLQVTWDVLTPVHRARPRIISVPLDVTTEAELLLLTNLVSLTPGTLSLDVTDDGRRLLVHTMFGEDEAAQIDEIKNGMERRVREIFG